MEAKKTFSANFERFRPLFLEAGMIVTLLIVFCIFNLKTYEQPVSRIISASHPVPEPEIIPITRREPPAPPPQKTISTQMIIVSNETEVKDSFTINAEARQETEVKPVDTQFIPTARKEEPEIVDEEIFVVVEQMPQYPGGEEARLSYLRKNLHYPSLASEARIQGTVFVSFVIEKNGAVTNIKIIRGIGGGCDEEAIKVVEGMPNWIPGKQRGNPVRVAFNMPIRFVLN